VAPCCRFGSYQRLVEPAAFISEEHNVNISGRGNLRSHSLRYILLKFSEQSFLKSTPVLKSCKVFVE